MMILTLLASKLHIAVVVICGIIIVAAAALCVKLKVRRHTVITPKVNGKIRVVHITDLHESLYGREQYKLIDAVKAASPDLIVITGDIVEDEGADPVNGKPLTADNPARMMLEKLPKTAPVYMVLGNHESNIPSTDMLCAQIESLGVRVLHRKELGGDDMQALELISDTAVRICGADDPYFDVRGSQKNHRTMANRIAEDKTPCTADKQIWRERLLREYAFIKDDTALTLLLSHRPEEFPLYEKLSFDAVFSGHAHGGQWRIPFIMNGLYAPHQGYFPKHAGGIYNCGKLCHVVSRGLSKRRFIRIFNRPEIWVVDFLPDK